jgi:hypothetical protein
MHEYTQMLEGGSYLTVSILSLVSSVSCLVSSFVHENDLEVDEGVMFAMENTQH